MRTYTRFVMIFLMFALIVSACATGQPDTQATVSAVYDAGMVAAKVKPSGQVYLLNGATIGDITPAMLAVSAVTTGQQGAFMLLNRGSQIAVFISPAGNVAGKAQAYLFAFVDVSKTALLSANRMLYEFGIDTQDIHSLEDLTVRLRNRGFEQLAPASVPTLYASLRLGVAFLKSLGGTITDLILVPAVLLTPDQLYPFCKEKPNSCVMIQQ